MNIIPRPQSYSFKTGIFSFKAKTKLNFTLNSQGDEAVTLLKERISSLTEFCLQDKTNAKSSISFENVEKLPVPKGEREAYRITVSPDKIVIEAVENQGLFYAVETLAALIEQNENSWFIPCCTILDWPDFEWRGMMIDPARTFIPVTTILAYIDRMARAKMNKLHIHFSDHDSFKIKSEKYPALNKRIYHRRFSRFLNDDKIFTFEDFKRFNDFEENCYSKEDIRKIVEYAGSRNIEIIPEISFPSHAGAMLRAIPEMKCDTFDGSPSDTVVCAGNERTYEILENIIADIAPLFPSEYFHAGMDEIEVHDIKVNGKPFFMQSWLRCKHCRDKMRQEGFNSLHELFYYFVNRIRDMFVRYGKKPIMWNDYIDIARPHNVTNDILIQFWQIALEGRGPRRGCSMNKFLKQGFKIVNSHYPETYVDLDQYMNEKRLSKWNPLKRPFSSNELKNQIIGSEMCAWGNGGNDFYPRVLPSAIPMFADRLWNKSAIIDLKKFGRALAKHILGPGLPSKIYQIFEYTGSIIPPRHKYFLSYDDGERTFPSKPKWEIQDFIEMTNQVIAAGKANDTLKEYHRIIVSQLTKKKL